MPDYTIKQGDTAPVFQDTLSYSDGTVPDVTGHTIKFIMRALTASDVTTNATATIVNGPTGRVSYTPTAQDTALAGDYVGYWLDTTLGRAFPTVGELEIRVEENITTPGGARIVGLGDAKEHLNINVTDRTRDAKLLRMIDGLTPVIEFITGPILQRVYQNETYDGGTAFISLRHRPVVSVQSVVEYWGPIRYELTQVPTPDLGTTFSYMFEPSGRIVRRTAGGGITTFPSGMDQVSVTYTAGYQQVPANVRLGILELLRVNFQETQQGRPRSGAAGVMDDELGQHEVILGFFVPGRVKELLQPNRRHPSLA